MLSEHLAVHFARQATDVTVSEKNASNAPLIIAPITLPAANAIPKRITDVKIVPRIPVSKAGRIEHTQPRIPLPRTTAPIIGVNARYTTAMPNKTHKNAGVMVITAVKVRIAVIIPIIILATMELSKQLPLQVQLIELIHYSPPIIIYS